MKSAWIGSIAFSIVVLVGCGSDSQVGGGGGIEIPNGLTLTVSATDNQPAQGVAVRLLARESWVKRTLAGGSAVLDSAVTDSLGRVGFEVPTGEGYWIEASTGNMGVRMEGDGPGSKNAVLSSLSRLTGILTGEPKAGVRVRLAGTSRTSVTDDSGRFRFDSLPQSAYSVVGQDPGSQKLSNLGGAVVGTQPTDIHTKAIDTGSVVLDDFADGDNVWALTDLFGSAYWWIAASGEDLTSVFGVDGSLKAIQSDSTRRWMGITVDGSRLGGNPWAGLGLDLGPSNGTFPDFSAASSIRIQVRGKGTWNLNLIEERGDSMVTWAASIPVDSSWSTRRIAASNLAPTSGNPEAWNARRRKIRQFLFQTSASGHLDLGELAVEGASLSDWAK
jgi:hypothetical protein